MTFKAEADDFRRILTDARKFSPELAKNLRRNLRAAAKPLAQAARQGALDIPAKPPEDTGLRKALARSVTIETANSKKRAGVFIKAKQSKMPANQRTMPRAMRKKAFRHPVFGHRDRWVSQQGADWFDGPISAKAPIAERAIKDALTQTERAIGFK